MNTRWYERLPLLLEDVKESLIEHPNLHIAVDEGGRLLIRGTLSVESDGDVLDRFLIEILFPENYPKGVPVVREIGGRLPWDRARHVNPEDGSACLFIRDERWRAWPVGSSFRSFLDVPVRNYFLGQSFVEMGLPWPFGQWEHGEIGVEEFYKELLATDDLSVVQAYLECLSAKKLKDHWACPCGSGRRIMQCHWKRVTELRKQISRENAQSSLADIRKLMASRSRR